MKKIKKFAGIALAGAIGLSGLGILGTNEASAAEKSSNSSNVMPLNFINYATFNYELKYGGQDFTRTVSSNDSIDVSVIPPGSGYQLNFWMDNRNTSNPNTFKLYKNGVEVKNVVQKNGQYVEVRGLPAEKALYTVRVFNSSGSEVYDSTFRARLY